MKNGQLEELLDAVLYERRTPDTDRTLAQPNWQRFTLGCVYPERFTTARAGAESCTLRAECLFCPQSSNADIEITVRFLQPRTREIGRLRAPLRSGPSRVEPALDWVPALTVNDTLYQCGFEATEREIPASIQLNGEPTFVPFIFPGSRVLEPIRDERECVVAMIVRHQPAVAGALELTAEPAGVGGAFRLTLRVVNRSGVSPAESGSIESVLPRTFTSTHAILHAHAAEFISLAEPPAIYAAAAAACKNEGVWPALVGDEASHECDTMLAAPMILHDYPHLGVEDAARALDGTRAFLPRGARPPAFGRGVMPA